MKKSKIDFRVIPVKSLTSNDLYQMRQLFDDSYSQANYSYLEKSFARFRYISFANLRDELIGFAMADSIETNLPGLPEPQIVVLAGICCVATDYRRLGLFVDLEFMAASASRQIKPNDRLLVCGRMAHPASFRTINQFPATIPKYGVPLSEWQKEIGLKVAGLYGVDIDPETLVVIGDGSPCGYPKVISEVSDEEWLLFKAVNRERGDSLLGITWFPEAPPGWL